MSGRERIKGREANLGGNVLVVQLTVLGEIYWRLRGGRPESEVCFTNEFDPEGVETKREEMIRGRWGIKVVQVTEGLARYRGIID